MLEYAIAVSNSDQPDFDPPNKSFFKSLSGIAAEYGTFGVSGKFSLWAIFDSFISDADKVASLRHRDDPNELVKFTIDTAAYERLKGFTKQARQAYAAVADKGTELWMRVLAEPGDLRHGVLQVLREEGQGIQQIVDNIDHLCKVLSEISPVFFSDMPFVQEKGMAGREYTLRGISKHELLLSALDIIKQYLNHSVDGVVPDTCINKLYANMSIELLLVMISARAWSRVDYALQGMRLMDEKGLAEYFSACGMCWSWSWYADYRRARWDAQTFFKNVDQRLMLLQNLKAYLDDKAGLSGDEIALNNGIVQRYEQNFVRFASFGEKTLREDSSKRMFKLKASIAKRYIQAVNRRLSVLRGAR